MGFRDEKEFCNGLRKYASLLLFLGKPLFEFLHASGGVYQFAGSGIERMARGANLNLELLFGGAHSKLIAACAINFRLMIGGMNIFLHICVS